MSKRKTRERENKRMDRQLNEKTGINGQVSRIKDQWKDNQTTASHILTYREIVEET